jgi:putative nucleotidyltransferase with HDIG domain
MGGRNIEHYVEKVEQIPTLPIVSRQIFPLLGDENVSVKKVAELIEKDQALAVKILKVANSSFYGTLSKVSSIDHALVILGIEEVRSILLAFSIYNFFSNDNGDGFDRTRFWKHSIICSQVAKYLTRYFKMQRDDTLFLAGLIHDLGKVVFDKYFHGEFLQILDYISLNNESFSKGEKEILGITHYQVAAKLLQQWKFPEKVIMHVFYHHAPWQDKNYGPGSIVVYLANLFTKLAGYPCIPSEKKTEVSEFSDSKVMDFVVQSGFELDYQSIEKMIHQIQEFIAIESRNVLSFFGEAS